MKRILLAACLMTMATVAKADFMFHTSFFYNSNKVGNLTYSDYEAHLFIGMPVAVKEQLYIGPNATITEDNSFAGGSGTTEIGPRINYYFNSDKTFVLILGWNPYVKFDGAPNADGWSYMAGLGYELKINTNLYLGASVIQHGLTKSENGTDSKTSTLRPVISASLRFR